MFFKKFFVGLVLFLLMSLSALAISDSDKTTLNTYENSLLLAQHLYELEYNHDLKDVYPEVWDRGKKWKVISYTDIPSSGFTSAIYQNDELQEIIVAFGGTTAGKNDSQDVLQDMALVDTQSNAQQFAETKKKIEEAKLLSDSLGYTLSFTGHSLGGALAQFAGLETGLKSITFNTAPYGISQNVYNLLSEEGKARVTEQNNHIINIRAINDYVSAIGLSVDVLPINNALNIKMINGQVIHLRSLKTGHLLTTMLREYDEKYRELFGENSLDTEIYQNYSIFIDESQHLIIEGGGKVYETSIVVADKIKDTTKVLVNIAYDASGKIITTVLDTLEDKFTSLADNLNLSIDITYTYNGLNNALSLGGGVLTIIDQLHFDKLGNLTINAEDQHLIKTLTANLTSELQNATKLANRAIIHLDREILFYASNPALQKQLLATKAQAEASLRNLYAVGQTKIVALESLNVIGQVINLYTFQQNVFNIVNKIEEEKKVTVIDVLDVLSTLVSFNPIGAIGNGLYTIEKEIGNAIDITFNINNIYREVIYDIQSQFFLQYRLMAIRGFEGKDKVSYMKLLKSNRDEIRQDILNLRDKIDDTFILFGKDDTLKVLDNFYKYIKPSEEAKIVEQLERIYNKNYNYFLEKQETLKEEEYFKSIRLSDTSKPSQPIISSSSTRYDDENNVTLNVVASSSDEESNILFSWYYSPNSTPFATGNSINVNPRNDTFQTYYVKATNQNGDSPFNSITIYHKEYEIPLDSDIVLEPYTVTNHDGSTYRVDEFFLYGVVNSNVVIKGGTLDIQGSILTINGDLNLTGGMLDLNGGELTVNGNLIQSGGRLKVNNGTLIVKGDYNITSSSYLEMTQESDKVLVEGNFLMSSYYKHTTKLTAGVLEVKGNFTQKYTNNNQYVFDTSGTHKVIFSGTKKQVVHFDSYTSSHFNILEIKNNLVEFQGFLPVTKELIPNNHSLDNVTIYTSNFILNKSLSFSGDIGLKGYLDLNGSSLILNGDIDILSLNLSFNNGDLRINGDLNLTSGTLDLQGGSLTVNGNLIQSGGRLKVNNGTLIVKGDYNITSSSSLEMTQESDKVLVEGNFLMSSYYKHTTKLTAGVLEVKGNFTQKYTNNNQYVFDTSGTHKVIFSGTKKQVVHFDSYPSSLFNILEITNNSSEGVEFISNAYINLNLTATSCSTLLNLDNVTVNGDTNLSAPCEELICIEVITTAYNPLTGEEKDYSTPCDVPSDWIIGNAPNKLVYTKYDFNDDGVADILFRNSATGENLIYMQNPDGTRESFAYTSAISSSWEAVGVGKFNDDGIADILFKHQTTGKNLIFMQSADGSRESFAYTSPISNSWKVKGIADFNGDGIDDILFRHISNGQALIFFQNEDGSREGFAYTRYLSNRWELVGVGNFDNDHIADILFRDASSGKNLIFFQNADGTRKRYAYTSSISKSWSVEGVADFNKDGIDDILFRNASSGKNLIFFQKSDGTRDSFAYSSPISNRWSVAQVADFDGDGIADILFRNITNGKNLIYFEDTDGSRREFKYTNPISNVWKVVK